MASVHTMCDYKNKIVNTLGGITKHPKGSYGRTTLMCKSVSVESQTEGMDW